MQKFSIYPASTKKFPLEDSIAAIKKAGYDSICLDFSARQEGETVWENQVQLAHKYDLPIENVHLSAKEMSSIWSPGERGDFVANRLMEELKHMSELGIKIGVIHATWGPEAPPAPSTLALNRYEKAIEIAEKYDVKLALENARFAEPVCYLLDNISSPNLGFCYDIGHENACTPEIDYLDKYGHRLIAMHLHDNDGKEDMHTFPLAGTIDWKKKIAQLKKYDYFHKMITLECNIPYTDVYEGFVASLESARKIANT